jgi:hypothetical protein
MPVFHKLCSRNVSVQKELTRPLLLVLVTYIGNVCRITYHLQKVFVQETKKDNKILTIKNLLPYSLFCFHMISLHTVIPGVYLRRNIPVKNRKELSPIVD